MTTHPAPDNLLTLAEYLRDGIEWDGAPLAHGEVDWTSLPTFGGEAPRDTTGVWSWDADDLLVGRCADELEIVSRSDYSRQSAAREWTCQIEGNESVSIQAPTAEVAARRYVAGGDWSAEEDGWSGTGTLVVWVTDDSGVVEYVRVRMRDGRVES